MQLDDYAGAAAIAAAWADGLRPDPSLTVSAWADKHRVLSPRGANEAGPWRTSRTPYLKEIMDHLSPSHPCQRVVFMKGAQTGGSEAGNNLAQLALAMQRGCPTAVSPATEAITERGVGSLGRMARWYQAR
jgi:phage terminase large subunit GpA-like protein